MNVVYVTCTVIRGMLIFLMVCATDVWIVQLSYIFISMSSYTSGCHKHVKYAVFLKVKFPC